MKKLISLSVLFSMTLGTSVALAKDAYESNAGGEDHATGIQSYTETQTPAPGVSIKSTVVADQVTQHHVSMVNMSHDSSFPLVSPGTNTVDANQILKNNNHNIVIPGSRTHMTSEVAQSLNKHLGQMNTQGQTLKNYSVTGIIGSTTTSKHLNLSHSNK